MVALIVLSVALALDATAACASVGAGERSLRPVLTCALLFGSFQAGMSAAGWYGGLGVARYAAAWDHWIAFALLAALGARTIREGLTAGDEPKAARGIGALLVLAVATSVDALAAGVTLPLLGVPAVVAVGAIGLVTAALSLAGGLLGRSLGDRFGPKLEVLGGVVLVGLGVKILVEHLTAT